VSTTRTSNRTDRRDHGRQAEELRFLLRSLEDLDAEHATGGLSEERYEQLRAEYTARAADLARADERARAADRRPPQADAGAPRPSRVRKARRDAVRPVPGNRRRRRVIAVVAILALTGLGTIGTLGLLGGPGSTTTRTDAAAAAASASLDATVTALRRTVAQNPKDAAAHDALANALAQTGDLPGALKEFDAAVSADPKDAVALAYSGWIALLAGSTDKALDRLTEAEATAPGYPDAHAFRGIALLRSGGNPAEARAELERYLQLAPDGPMTQQVRDVIKQLGDQP
jgi:tetratricopeptide (TPR) repeat protein